jgi:hypothetical protein
VHLHPHKFYYKTVGWNEMGQIEVRLLMKQLEKMVVGTREVHGTMISQVISFWIG